jgi:quercetin dioxygenase-like cupin family protein
MARSIQGSQQKSRLDSVRELSPSRAGAAFRCAPGQQGWIGPPHHHDELEVNLVIQGHASYLLEGRRYDIGRQTLLWILPHHPHLLFEHSHDFVMCDVGWPSFALNWRNCMTGTMAC